MAETKFSVMSSLFTWMQKSKSSSIKRSKFRKFLDTFCRPKNGDDYFAAIRLILPTLDRERGSYGLREHVLATCLIDAIGMSRDSPDAQRLINWRKGGPKSGAFAGNFSLVAAEVLQRRQGMSSGGLTIKELNDMLDRLSTCEKRPEKTAILSDLIMKTNAQEMKWIIMIILKDLKLGISEKSIFHEFHPDAEDLFNVTCDLKLVCEKLRDRSQRHKRQDIEVGKAVRPQLAMRVSNAAAAWKKLHGKEVIAECKFDGDRIQIHKNGTDINFFSRNFHDHPEYEHGMSAVIRENVMVDRCILDGEMLVWDKSANRFADFGSNQEIAKAAREGLESDRQLCYVAFDVLYVGDTSVIHQTLKERHQLLQRVVKPIAGRLEILVPNGGLNTHHSAGEPCWSLIVHDVDGVERFFKETIENRDEGIVLKDLGSKWEPSDRSGKWLKLKPEYIRAGSDLDVLIIGGYYGSGRRGGEIAQFLVGLAERVSSNAHPRRFVSFCRVGTGLSDEELDAVVTKLKPYLRKYEYPKKAAPSFYQVTNNSKERPDVWVESPEKSIIVSITSDIRTIRSEVFAAPYGLRFPRIDRVRYDKPWHECLDVQSFVELVHSSNGTTQRAANDDMQEEKPKRKKVPRGDKKNLSAVPSHFVQTDVSQVKGNTTIFSSMVFYFVNVPSPYSRDSLHKMVAENGGTFSMNLNNTVTHSIASESKGIKFQAAKRHGDVIDYSWFFDCCSQKKLLPLLPKYFLSLSDKSKEKLQEEIDELSDSYYMDINIVDLKQMLGNIHKAGDLKAIDYYKKKFCPKEEWIRFHGCCIYFHLPSGDTNWRVPFDLAIRRMKIEISRVGGTVAETLSGATHLVVISGARADVDFDELLSSFSGTEKRLLRSSRLQIVKSEWLEDSFQQNQKLPEESYKLKPLWSEETLTEDSTEQDLTGPREEHGIVDNIRKTESCSSHKGGTKSISMSDEPRVISLPKREASRKRGRPQKGQAVVNQPRRTRPRVANKPAKISENESDNSVSSDDKTDFAASRPNDKDSEVGKTKGRSDLNKTQSKRAQIRNKHAVISENESEEERASADDMDSEVGKSKGRADVNKPQRKRAQIRNKRAVISGNESEEEHASDEKTVKEDSEVGKTNDVQMKDVNKYSRSSSVGGEVEAGVREHAKHGREMSLGEINEIGSGSESKVPYKEQLEDTISPIQAMLFSLMPSLAPTKTDVNPTPKESTSKQEDPTQTAINPIPEESTFKGGNPTQTVINPILEESTSKGEDPTRKDVKMHPIPEEFSSRGWDSTQKDVNLPVDADMKPVKKKKVSYKDMANELLKDW